MRHHLSPTLSLFLLLPSTLAVSLSQFQTIANFPDTCTKAYDSQINGCTASDFSNGSPCSTSCMSGLQSLTILIDSACAGSQADPTTLIGMFFVGKGLTALCPNYMASIAEASSTHGASSTPSAVIIETSTLVVSSAVVIETSTLEGSSMSTHTSQTSSSIITHTSSSVITHTSSSISTPTSTTTASSASPATTSSSASVLPVPVSQSTPTITSTSITAKPSTSSSIDRPTFVKTAVNDGSMTVLTSKADQTASPNPDAFGGGGSPFEISAGVKGVDEASRVALLAVFAGLVWVL